MEEEEDDDEVMAQFTQWDWMAEETSRSADQNCIGSMYPIWRAALTHMDISYEFSSVGDRRKGFHYLRLATACDPDMLELLPDLEHLSKHIVVFLHNYEQDSFDIEVCPSCRLHMVCMIDDPFPRPTILHEVTI